MTTDTTHNPVTLITGANKGIGLATARQLVDLGHTVYVGARDPERGTAAAEAIGARFVRLDVTGDASVSSALATIEAAEGRLDLLVNNAGVMSTGTPDGPSALLAFDTNAVGVVRVTEAALPLLRRGTRPHVVTVSSSMGSFWAVTSPERVESTLPLALYAASKAAATMLTVQYAKAHPDVRFNAVEPGPTATDMTAAWGIGRPVEQSAAVVVDVATRTDDATGTIHDETARCPGSPRRGPALRSRLRRGPRTSVAGYRGTTREGTGIAPGGHGSTDDTVLDADAAIVLGGAPPSARVPLDRDRIVAAALEHIEDAGLATLTMRRLGTRLGVEAMSLYRYVPGKEDLLDAVVERLIRHLHADPEVLDEPTDGWQDFLQRLAHGVRRVALAHPRSFPLVASRPPEAPWLRPPLRSLDWVETFLSGLCAEGFSDAAAVAGYRAFTGFLLGHLLLEVSTMGADIGPLDVLDDGEDDDPGLAGFPTVARLRSGLREDHAAVEFEAALEELLDRIAAIRVEL